MANLDAIYVDSIKMKIAFLLVVIIYTEIIEIADVQNVKEYKIRKLKIDTLMRKDYNTY
jgi:hypothetical protein